MNRQKIKPRYIYRALSFPRPGIKKSDISALEIAGYDEKRYRVADDLIGRRLRQFVHERVEVEGLIKKSPDGHLFFILDALDKSTVLMYLYLHR